MAIVTFNNVSLQNVAAGIGGFKIIGENGGDLAGYSVSSLGDVNGDGRPDLLVGAYLNDAGGTDSGAAYVVFGKADGIAVNLDAVANGIGGFKIVGENAGDRAGHSVSSLGDVNGDGRADMLVGAYGNGAGITAIGAAYVVFGKTDGAAVNLDNVANGSGGFKIVGENVFGWAGWSVSGLGDVNGDGRPDLLVGQPYHEMPNPDSGAAYVVFGKADGTTVNLANVAAGSGGFKILGENAGDRAGFSVSSLGDVNGDGRPDLVIGAIENAAGGTSSGAAYVVYGKADGSAVNLATVAGGSGGFKINGENALDRVGWVGAVSSLGDVNGDGRADLLVGALGNDAGGADSGAAYVVFGKADGTAVNLDDVAAGVGGFKIIGENAGDAATVVSSLGDVNGDGRADLLVGAAQNAAGGTNSGAAYVVFGKADGSAVNLDNVALGHGGFKITGENADDLAGLSVSSLGDLNGDGRPELLVGAPVNDAGGTDSGAAYVVFTNANEAPTPNDLNGDHTSDLLLQMSHFGFIGEWLIQNGHILAGNPLGFTGDQFQGLGDFNGDGTADVLWRNAGGIGEWQMQGGHINAGISLGFAAAPDHVAGIGDFNGDNTADILFHSDSGFVGEWLMQNGHINAGVAVGFADNTNHVVGVGDFNADGTSDILWRNDSGFIGLWQMQNGHVNAGVSVGFAAGGDHVAGVGDFNGDGTSDILWRNDSGQIGMWLMQNGHVNAGLNVAFLDNTWHVADVADYNADGKADILFINDSGQVGVWLMDGNHIAGAPTLGSLPTDWHIVG